MNPPTAAWGPAQVLVYAVWLRGLRGHSPSTEEGFFSPKAPVPDPHCAWVPVTIIFTLSRVFSTTDLFGGVFLQ